MTESSIRQHNAAFEKLLSFIPAKFYLAEDPTKIVTAEINPGLSKKKRKAAAEVARAEIKEAARKAKRAKYDPATPRSVLELQAVKLAALTQDAPSSSRKHSNANDTTPKPSISELRERLHAKIASLSAASKVPSPALESPALPGTREALIQQTQKERMAEQEAKSVSKKQAKKAARKEFQQALDAAAAKKAHKAPPTPSSPVVEPSSDPSAASDDDEEDTEMPDAGALVPSTSAIQTDISFSNLDFASTSTAKPLDSLHRSKIKSAKADPKAALAKINDRKKFLEKLNPASRERAEEKSKWGKVEAKLSGEKVLDDEGKLRKMIKRKDKERRQSKKDWVDREETQAKSQADQQKKRNDNLQARINQKKDKKSGGKKGKSAGGAKKTQSRGFERSGGSKHGKYKSGSGANRGGGLKK